MQKSKHFPIAKEYQNTLIALMLFAENITIEVYKRKHESAVADLAKVARKKALIIDNDKISSGNSTSTFNCFSHLCFCDDQI